MAYIAEPSGSHAGVYEYVLELSEQKAARTSEFTTTGHGGFFRCPHHRRVEAMLRGEPVTVPEYLLPPAVRQSAEFRRVGRAVGRNGNSIRRRLTATVYSDGRITYRDETFEEQTEYVLPGEIPNYSGPPPKDYATDYNHWKAWKPRAVSAFPQGTQTVR